METLQTKVDQILTADIVVTMDAQYHVYTPGAIAVRGDSIVAVGAPEDVLAQYAAPAQ